MQYGAAGALSKEIQVNLSFQDINRIQVVYMYMLIQFNNASWTTTEIV